MSMSWIETESGELVALSQIGRLGVEQVTRGGDGNTKHVYALVAFKAGGDSTQRMIIGAFDAAKHSEDADGKEWAEEFKKQVAGKLGGVIESGKIGDSIMSSKKDSASGGSGSSTEDVLKNDPASGEELTNLNDPGTAPARAEVLSGGVAGRIVQDRTGGMTEGDAGDKSKTDADKNGGAKRNAAKEDSVAVPDQVMDSAAAGTIESIIHGSDAGSGEKLETGTELVAPTEPVIAKKAGATKGAAK